MGMSKEKHQEKQFKIYMETLESLYGLWEKHNVEESGLTIEILASFIHHLPGNNRAIQCELEIAILDWIK